MKSHCHSFNSDVKLLCCLTVYICSVLVRYLFSESLSRKLLLLSTVHYSLGVLWKIIAWILQKIVFVYRLGQINEDNRYWPDDTINVLTRIGCL